MPAGGLEADALTSGRAKAADALRVALGHGRAPKRRPRERRGSREFHAFPIGHFDLSPDAFENRSAPSRSFFDGQAPFEKRLPESERIRGNAGILSGRGDSPRPAWRRIPAIGHAAAPTRIAATAYPPEPGRGSANARAGMTDPRAPSDRLRRECGEAGSVADSRSDSCRGHPRDAWAHAGFRNSVAGPMDARPGAERIRGEVTDVAPRTPRRDVAGASGISAGRRPMDSRERA